MAQVTIRFQGRFVYAISNATKRITVLAPNFAGRFSPHQPLMTIAGSTVVFKDPNVGQTLTNLDPMCRVAADVTDLRRAELFVWDLSGRTVTYDVVDTVQLNAGASAAGQSVEVLDLATLEKLSGRTAALSPNAQQLSNAVIELSAGIGTAKLAFPDLQKCKFVTEEDDAAGLPDFPITNASGEPEETLVAELVDFVITLPDSQPYLTLRVTPPGGEAGMVTIRHDAMICFSHMCAPLHPRRRNDIEFSQYYDLLASPPGPERLIPVEPPTPKALAEGMDCWAAAQIRID